MNSLLDPAFVTLYRALPDHVRQRARKHYRLWKSDPAHPSLHYKRISNRTETYSVRVGKGWRAFGIKADNTMIWFWIGSHRI